MFKSLAKFIAVFTLTGTTHCVLAQTNFWEQTGLISVSVQTLGIGPSGIVFAGSYSTDRGGCCFSSDGLFRSTNSGDSWTAIGFTGTAAVLSLAFNGSGDVFAGTPDSGVYRSTNNGDTWNQVGLRNIYVGSLAVNSSGSIFAGTADSGIFRSTNNGDSWSQVGLTNARIYVGGLAVNASGYIFAGTVDSGVYRSTNNGDSWTQVGLTNVSVFSLAVKPNGAGGTDLFAGATGNVFRSTDDGDYWTLVNTGFMNTNVHAIAINSRGDIFAGIDGGVFRSSDNGESWNGINSGLTSFPVDALAIDTSGRVFAGTGIPYIATEGGFLFRSLESTTSMHEVSRELPATFDLEQNFPNPFNPGTRIRFRVARSEFVELKVLDILGREVTTLVNEDMKPGSHEIEWNATDFASGVYFYRLQTGNFSDTKKLVLLR